MPAYIIGYDLNSPGQDYKDLIAAIKSYGTYWHHLDSTWVVVTDRTAAQIRDHLSPFLDQGDELLVVKSGVESSWKGFNDAGSKWLYDNL